MFAIECPKVSTGGGRRLADESQIVTMLRTDAEVVLTVACPCGELHTVRIPRRRRVAQVAVVPSVEVPSVEVPSIVVVPSVEAERALCSVGG